jgi:endonuclease YncB( thermonuclease family)
MKHAHIVIAFALMSVSTFDATVPPPADPSVTVTEVRIVDVIDGDTYVCEPVNNRFTVRVANADTWESRRVRRAGSGEITDAEIARGLEAKDKVLELLCSGPVYVVSKPSSKHEAVERDSFGRILARVRVQPFDGSGDVDVGDWLAAHGHTRN